MSAENPLRQIHNALWALLAANDDFDALVPAGLRRVNWIGSSRAPEVDEGLSPADYPRVRIVPVKIKPHLQRTSNGSSLDVIWQVQVATGDQRLQTLLDIEWAVYRALLTWETHLRDDLRWSGKEFVKLARPLETETNLDDKKQNRGTRGWSAVWTGETRLWFTTSDL